MLRMGNPSVIILRLNSNQAFALNNLNYKKERLNETDLLRLKC